MQDLRESNRQDRGTYCGTHRACTVSGHHRRHLPAAEHRQQHLRGGVSARARQYGAMRAVGMEDVQLCRMIAAEGGTYAASGLLVGVAAGLVLHRVHCIPG